MVWTGFICVRTGTSGGLLWTQQWNFGFHKRRGIFRLAEWQRLMDRAPWSWLVGWLVGWLVSLICQSPLAVHRPISTRVKQQTARCSDEWCIRPMHASFSSSASSPLISSADKLPTSNCVRPLDHSLYVHTAEYRHRLHLQQPRKPSVMTPCRADTLVLFSYEGGIALNFESVNRSSGTRETTLQERVNTDGHVQTDTWQ